MRRGLSLGALSLLSGCDLTYDDNVQRVLTAIFVTNENPGGYWEDKGYNWFSGS